MSWSYPHVLWALAVLPALALVELRVWSRANREMPALAGARGDWPVRAFFRDLSAVFLAVSLVLAAADPQGGRAPVAGEGSGLDVVLAVDVSRSMLAEDVDPSRLDRAASLARLLAASLDDARFALVPFKGDASVAVPMTEDRAILDLWLDRLGPGLSTAPGTDVEAALRTAVSAFPPGEGRRRVLVLITDGEALSGQLDRIGRELAEEGQAVYAVAVGTGAGAPIPLPGGNYVASPDGETVVSRADVPALTRLASVTGGAFVDISRPGASAALLKDIEDDRAFVESRGIRFRPVSRYRMFLVPSLVFLLSALASRVFPWRRG